MDDKPWQRWLSCRPVWSPELVAKGERYTLFRKLLVDAGGSKCDSNDVAQGTQSNEHSQSLLCLRAKHLPKEQARDSVARLQYDFFWRRWKVRDIRKQVQESTDTEPKRSCDFERAHGVLDVVENVVDVRPSCVGIEDFERCRCVLCRCDMWVCVMLKDRWERLTSLLLCELPSNALRKLTCGSATRVLPDRTTQPVTTMKTRIMILNTLRACTSLGQPRNL